MSGTLNIGFFEINTDSIGLNQMEDVFITSETHNDLIRFNDNATDPTYTDGFVNKSGIQISEVDDINVSSTPPHNSLFSYNDNSVISSIVDGWIEKSINDILGDFQITVDGLVNIQLSIRLGRQGNPALSDMVAFTDVIENTFTMGISSCGDNNIIYKRELSDTDFVYQGVLSKGEILNLSYPAGTIFRSTKGITGFSSTFPTPMGISSMSSKIFRFFAFRHACFVTAASSGLECTVTLFGSNGSTVIDGPTTIPPYGSTTLACNSNTEFIVSSTNEIYCSTYADHTTNGLTIDQRILPPMTNELIVWNRQCRITAQELNTTVTWYRRNGETNSFTINAGSPVGIHTGNITGGVAPINAGNTTDYGQDGCLILKSDKPISGFSGADSNGWEATPAWPLDQTSQLFANPATLNNSSDGGVSSVTIGSQYEGSGSVYDSTGSLVGTFFITRSISPATTPDEQIYPAAGQWQPVDGGLNNWTGGWVQTNVPSICIMNFSGSSIWSSDAGDEMLIPGITPDEIRAEIVKDAGGLFRRRDISATGVETWNIC